MAPGALPHPSRVLEQRLLSPEICLRQRRRCGTLLEISPIDLGFSAGRLLIGEGASSGVDQGGHTGWARPGAGSRPLMVRLAPGPPLALVWSSILSREK
jgi:hypothetical protein